MRAWVAHEFGEPANVLHLEDTEIPEPGRRQLQVKVLAAALNFPDVLMCRGQYQVQPTPPFTPGVELCGRVVAVGEEVETSLMGRRLIGMPPGLHGAHAEYAVLDAAAAFTPPESLDDAQASALYIGHQTAWFALCRRAHVTRGAVVLVLAAAGGVGSAAVQIARSLGATVIAVVGSEAKVAHATTLGAHYVVDRQTQDFVSVANDVTRGRGVDVVFDPVGGESYERATKCVAFEGTIVVVGFAGGEIQRARLNHPLIKNYSIAGLHWGLYSHKAPHVIREAHDKISTLVAADPATAPILSERCDMAGLPDGLRRLAQGATVGRVVLVP